MDRLLAATNACPKLRVAKRKRVAEPATPVIGRAPSGVRAGVAELVDALDLGSSIERCGGSSPFARTNRRTGMPPTSSGPGKRDDQDCRD